MRVVLRYRDGWWMAFLEGYGIEFAMSRSFEHLVCDLVDASYRVIAVERRKYATAYSDDFPSLVPEVRSDDKTKSNT